MKNFIILILTSVVIYLTYRIITAPLHRADTIGAQIEQKAKENVRIEAEIIKRKVDEKGIEAVIIEETAHVLNQAGGLTDTVTIRIIDSLQKLANNRLISYTAARAEVVRLQKEMKETDTSFSYRDKWLTVDVTKPADGRPAILNSAYNAEYELKWYRERRRWLSPLKTYGEFSLLDPNARITGVRHLRIEPPADRFGFSMQAVGLYAPNGEVYTGFGATLRTGRLRLNGAYVTDMRGEWMPTFRGEWVFVEW